MWEELIRQYGYWMVFGGTVLQGDATIIAAGFLAHRGYLNLGLAAGTALMHGTNSISRSTIRIFSCLVTPVRRLTGWQV